jgi:hypothetical protein
VPEAILDKALLPLGLVLPRRQDSLSLPLIDCALSLGFTFFFADVPNHYHSLRNLQRLSSSSGTETKVSVVVPVPEEGISWRTACENSIRGVRELGFDQIDVCRLQSSLNIASRLLRRHRSDRSGKPSRPYPQQFEFLHSLSGSAAAQLWADAIL